MNKNYYTILVVLIVLSITGGACTSKNDQIDTELVEPEIISEIVQTENGNKILSAIKEGKRMPHGKLVNQQDKPIKTQSLLGKYVVINLWATWCKPCLTHTPMFQEIAADYPNATFISVSIDKEKPVWSLFLLSEEWTGEHYWMGTDDSNPFYSFAYSNVQVKGQKGVHVSVPKYIIISPEGKIIKGNFPGPGTPKFREMLDKHLL